MRTSECPLSPHSCGFPRLRVRRLECTDSGVPQAFYVTRTIEPTPKAARQVRPTHRCPQLLLRLVHGMAIDKLVGWRFTCSKRLEGFGTRSPMLLARSGATTQAGDSRSTLVDDEWKDVHTQFRRLACALSLYLMGDSVHMCVCAWRLARRY